MKETYSKQIRLLFILLICSLVLSLGTVGFFVWDRQSEQLSMASQPMDSVEKYTLFIGTNDKDTYEQIISTEEAREIVNQICEKHTGGYTVMDARGGWVDETGTETKENSLVYSFYGVSEEQILNIMDEVLIALNQNSILVERETVQSLYYSKGR